MDTKRYKNKWLRAPNGNIFCVVDIKTNTTDPYSVILYDFTDKCYTSGIHRAIFEWYKLDELEEELLGVSNLFKLSEDRIGDSFSVVQTRKLFEIYKLIHYSNKTKTGQIQEVQPISSIVNTTKEMELEVFYDVNECGEVFDNTGAVIMQLKIL